MLVVINQITLFTNSEIVYNILNTDTPPTITGKATVIEGLA